MIDALADCHLRDVRRQAAQRRIRPPGARAPGARARCGGDRRQRLRSRIGFMLVEAGFHLLATTGSIPRD
jgi:hypothetical protein